MYDVLGAILGAVGQSLRVIAGVLCVIELLGTEITKEFMITLIAVGYAGTDFIEWFMKRSIPKTN